MNTKHCETCGKLLICVKADRRFCGACMQLRRKSQSRHNNTEKNKDFTKKP